MIYEKSLVLTPNNNQRANQCGFGTAPGWQMLVDSAFGPDDLEARVSRYGDRINGPYRPPAFDVSIHQTPSDATVSRNAPGPDYRSSLLRSICTAASALSEALGRGTIVAINFYQRDLQEHEENWRPHS